MLALDSLLDAALADSFPASDPPALCSPHGRRSKYGANAETYHAPAPGALERVGEPGESVTGNPPPIEPQLVINRRQQLRGPRIEAKGQSAP